MNGRAKKVLGEAMDLTDEERADVALELVASLDGRQNVDFVRARRQALARGLASPLDLALVQVIFDYRPEEWYRPATLREPPEMVGSPRLLIAEMLGLAAQAQGEVALDERTALVVRDFVRSHTP